jgi:hypothetical protein
MSILNQPGPRGYVVFDPQGVKMQYVTYMVKILQSECMHDTAIITLQGANLSAPALQPGTPMFVTYGNSPGDVDTFYGYIDHVAPHYERTIPDVSSYEDIVCMGESYVMKDPLVGSWSGIQASTLVREIASSFKLAALIQTDDYAWPQLSCSGDSAWSFLTQLAHKVGYTLAVNKNLLRFTSVKAGLRQSWAGMPVFNTRKTAPNTAQQGISKFQALQGEALGLPGHTKALRTISGMDSTGKIVGAFNDGTSVRTLGQTTRYPFFVEQISDTVVTSQGSAAATLVGMTESNRFQYQAAASLVGLTSVTQGTPIVLAGLDDNENGVWWVQEVEHVIKAAGYFMDVSLGRDSVGDTGLRPNQYNGVAYSPSNPFTYAIHSAPPTVLVQQRWRSANQFNVFVTGGQ